MAGVSTQIFDSIAVRAVACELATALSGTRLEKVHRTDRLEFLLVFRGGGRKQLLVSARGPFSRVHLTSRSVPAGGRSGPFGTLLRKHFEGARLVRVSQPGLERAIGFMFDARDDLGDPVVRTLIAELTGSHSNLVLLDGDAVSGTILAALRPVTDQMSRVRQILPGMPYDPPPVDARRQDPEIGDVRVALARGGSAEKALLAHFHSLSRVAVAQIVAEAGTDSDSSGAVPAGDPLRSSRPLLGPEGPSHADADTDTDANTDADTDADTDTDTRRLVRAWEHAFRCLREGRFFPRLVVGQPWDYALIPPLGTAEPQRASVSELLDAYYGEKWEAREAEALRLELERTIAGEIRRHEARIDLAAETLASAESADRHRRWGDLLLTYAHEIAPGADSVILVEPETGEALSISLDPARSPTDNAQRHYKAYRKALSARQVQERIRDAAQADLVWWQERSAELESAPDKVALDALARVIVDDSGQPSARPGAEAGPERYRSADGFEILVGRNNKQNDYITTRLARPEDWWFHAQKVPGSHVIVRAPGNGSLPEKTAQQAALLAAWYSKARSDTRVPVAFTRRKYV
ncbi:MAG: NFACT family protein, partial [Candidatus Sericytochromatia bacterium]|nr:NFACT family protein [Candidatus Tanganyikabacteria bacterium]